jgi:uncharacterized protein (DUF433 family)
VIQGDRGRVRDLVEALQEYLEKEEVERDFRKALEL